MVQFGLKVKPRKYMCLNCGNVQEINTNHTASLIHRCEECSWKPSWYRGGYIPNRFGSLPTKRKFVYFNKPKIKLIKEHRKKSIDKFGGLNS